jgi:hypothetical protein
VLKSLILKKTNFGCKKFKKIFEVIVEILMTEILELTTAEGRTVSCQFTAVEGISQTLTFFDMQEPDDVDYWRSYFEDYCTEIAQHLLEHVTTVKLSVSCNGNYEQHDTGQLSEPIVMNSKFPTTLTRHTIDLERKVEGQFLAVHDPSEYYMRLQEQFGSNIGHLENYNTFTMSFLFPTNSTFVPSQQASAYVVVPYQDSSTSYLTTAMTFASSLPLPWRKASRP